jgi:hypothetical protein
MECAGALLRLLCVFGLVLGAGMARRGRLPPQFRVRPVGSLPAGMQPLVGKSGEFRPAPAAAVHRVSAQALATASLLAAFVCLATTFDSEALAADSSSGSGSGSGSRTQYTKSSESPLPPRLSTWDLFGRIQRLEDTSFTKEDADAMEARMEARMDKAEARMDARMDKAEARMQGNFLISTFLTIVSLFVSLAANEKFVAKFP